MIWLRDTIAGRTILVLMIGLGSILTFTQYLYQVGVEREARVLNTTVIVDRLLFVADSILSVDVDKRDDTAHRLSDGALELHWGKEPLATTVSALDDAAQRLRDRLIERSPQLANLGLVVGTSRAEKAPHATERTHGDGHATLIALPLRDGSWLNATLARVQLTRPTAPSVLLSAALGAFGVVLVSVLMGRWLARPLESLATGARQLFVTAQSRTLPETGTREVRTLAAAINDLQARIRRLIDDRTQMLAAVGHDLRTPLTRLRLRIRGVTDPNVLRSIEADLDEMEEMINATLAFLREGASTEKVEPVDLSAILDTIAADAEDAGHAVKLDVQPGLILIGRHLALKRALTNLVQNAIRYGGRADVFAEVCATKTGPVLVRISIRDEGPGIPAESLEAVFQPFYRLESSRGRSTGGHGLGLPVARTIIQAHGGDVTLSNLHPNGIEACVTLPLDSRSA